MLRSYYVTEFIFDNIIL